MIHPFFNAQFGTVQLMLNALCPLGAKEAGGRQHVAGTPETQTATLWEQPDLPEPQS